MNTISGKQACFILAIIILFHFIGNFFWLDEGPCLYGKDVAGHLKLTAKIYYRLLSTVQSRQPVVNRAISFFALFQEPASPFAEGTWVWPKLLHIYVASLCLIFGLNAMTMILSNILWLVIALISVAYLGTRMVNRRAGLLAAFVLSFYPGVYGLSRQYGTDLPLMAMVAASMAVLVGTDCFRNRAILFGLILGLGLLVKAQILFFIFFPFLYFVATAFISRKKGGKSAFPVLMKAGVALGVGAIVSSIWWFPIARPLFRSFITLTSEDTGFLFSHSFRPFTLAWVLYYARAAAINISVLFTVFFIVSVPFFIRSKARFRGLVVIWLFGAYLIYTFIKSKTASYFFPVFPALALVTASGLLNIGKRRVRTVLIGILVAGAVVQFWVFSFVKTSFNPLPVEGCSFDTATENYYFPPFENNYEEVAGDIVDILCEKSPNLEFVRVGLVEMSGNLWQQNFSDISEYYMRLRNPNFYLYRSHFNREAFLRYAPAFNFVIVMDRNEGLSRLDKAFPRGLIEAAFGSVEAFQEVIHGYSDYEVLGQWNLLPERIPISLLGIPPVFISPGVEIPAVRFFRSNMYCRFPFVGTSEALAAEKTEQDYDMFLPVESEPGTEDGPWFSEYYIYSNEDGMFSLQIKYSSENDVRTDIFLDGEPIANNLIIEGTGGEGDHDFRWGDLCDLRMVQGEHILRIESAYLPVFEALRIRKKAD